LIDWLVKYCPFYVNTIAEGGHFVISDFLKPFNIFCHHTFFNMFSPEGASSVKNEVTTGHEESAPILESAALESLAQKVNAYLLIILKFRSMFFTKYAQVPMTSIQEECGLDNAPPLPAVSAAPLCDNVQEPSSTSTITKPSILDVPDVLSHVKVENYLLQLAQLPANNTSLERKDSAATVAEGEEEEEREEVSSPISPLSPGQELASVSGGGPKQAAAARDRLASEDEANTSVCSSRVSRMSDLSNLTGRFSHGGAFYGAMMLPSTVTPAAPVCPFPDEWQYNTIPEVIENDEEID
jgi:hypothetical protein